MRSNSDTYSDLPSTWSESKQDTGHGSPIFATRHTCGHTLHLCCGPADTTRVRKNKASQASICDCRRLTQWVSDVTRPQASSKRFHIPGCGGWGRPCTARAMGVGATHESSNQESLLKMFRPQIERSPSGTRPKRYGDCDSARRKNCYTSSTSFVPRPGERCMFSERRRCVLEFVLVARRACRVYISS